MPNVDLLHAWLYGSGAIVTASWLSIVGIQDKGVEATIIKLLIVVLWPLAIPFGFAASLIEKVINMVWR